MASINKVILIGNLGRDPEMGALPNGTAACKFSIATTRSWKDHNGIKQEKTEWHNIVTYDKLADICGQWLKKGKQVYIEGRLETKKWQDKNTGIERSATQIIAHEMTMLGKAEEVEPQKFSYTPPPKPAPAPIPTASVQAAASDFADDIPF